jgi:putative autotransporter adhesin-like protein
LKTTNNHHQQNITKMKKTIVTAAIALSIVFGISRPASAATGSTTEVSTVLPGISNISEIEAYGNVQVYLTTGSEDKVKVYNDYYADNALVQEQNGVLHVTSYKAEKLVVWVTANNLSKVSAYDHAEVKSFGKFSAIDLDVNLYDNALALLNMDAFDASFNVNDHAMAALSGNAESASVSYDPSARVLTGRLTATNLTEKVNGRPMKHFRPMEFASL